MFLVNSAKLTISCPFVLFTKGILLHVGQSLR